MADDKKKQPIIIKKIAAPHHGGHGGAWKVAYADFVTAMMCFFLVMWLMGSDEETKAAVANYFNNPTSAWRRDLANPETAPLGDMTGQGENVLKGANGEVPEEMVKSPSVVTKGQDGIEKTEAMKTLLADDSFMNVEVLKFSVPENELFASGSSDQFTPKGKLILNRLGRLSRGHPGTLAIKTQIGGDGRQPAASEYETQMSRAVALGRYLVDQRWIDQDRLKTSVKELRSNGSADEAEPASGGRKIEFTFSKSVR